MPAQPQPLPDAPDAPPQESAQAPPPPIQAELSYPPPPRPNSSISDPAPIWAQRISLLILVTFCIQLGAIVTILPWWHAVWDYNGFFFAHPRLWAVMRLGPVRGIISGLGLIDIWIGVSEAIHYRDHRP
jgi:hypothetical protein